MPLAPGPFNLQYPGSLNFTVENYDFTGSVLSDQTSLDAEAAQIDLLLPDIEAFTAPTVEPIPGVDLDAVQLAIDPGRFDFVDTSGNDVITALGDGEAALGIAIAGSPAQAWQNPAAPFVPDLAFTLTAPVVPSGVYQPGQVTSVGPTPITTPPATGSTPAPSVTLLNTTQYGNPNFSVGDQFLLTVTGPPNQDVTAGGTFNGADLGTTLFGQTDGNGQFQIANVMQTVNVGAWTENWYVGGHFISSINFLVIPSGNPNL